MDFFYETAKSEQLTAYFGIGYYFNNVCDILCGSLFVKRENIVTYIICQYTTVFF